MKIFDTSNYKFKVLGPFLVCPKADKSYTMIDSKNKMSLHIKLNGTQFNKRVNMYSYFWIEKVSFRFMAF